MNDQQNDGGKAAKRFETAMQRLAKIMEGTSLLDAIPKVNGIDVTTLVQELAKEEKEALGKEFKEKALSLIKSKKNFDKFQKEALQKMKKELEAKQKEFAEEADKLFNLMEKAQNIEKEYVDTLKSAEEGKSSLEENEDK